MKQEQARKKARTGAWGWLLVAMAFSGCAWFTADKHTYAGSAGATLNGATLGMQVRPEGDAGPGYMVSAMVVAAGSATLDGPFSWRIEATGQAGKHQRLIVHRIHTRTAVTKHAEWYPAKELGGSVEFRPRKESPGTAVARYRIPGLLKVKPSVDGALTVTADVSVQADGRWERGMVKFRLDPNRKRQTESLFLPAELIKGIGSDPRDWDDPLWD